MRRERDESSTARESLFLIFSCSSMLAAAASLMCYFMSRGAAVNEGIDGGVLLAALMLLCGFVLGLVGLLSAYSRGTMVFGLASLAANALVFVVIEMR